MRSDKKAVMDVYQIGLTKGFDGSPEGRLTATGHLSDGTFFRVDLTVICPKPEQPKHDLPLTEREMENVVEAISDTIKSLNKQVLSEHSVG